MLPEGVELAFPEPVWDGALSDVAGWGAGLVAVGLGAWVWAGGAWVLGGTTGSFVAGGLTGGSVVGFAATEVSGFPGIPGAGIWRF